ncbi:MAG: hypothetical protein WC998_05160 [Candidatus Paceibacterota bacterium]|jgi:hypothetical protein
MKRDDVTTLFPDATKEQVDKLMTIYGDDVNTVKSKYSVDQSELERLKLIEEEHQKTKDATLSAEEKYQKAIKEKDEQTKRFARELNRMKAENILVTAGLKVEEVGDLFEGIVSDDADATAKRATSLASLLKTKTEAAEKAKETELLQGMETPPAGQQGVTTVTPEEFSKMGYESRVKLKAENPETYKQLTTDTGGI